MSFNESIGVQFDPERLESLIASRAVPVIHEIGVACPCVNIEEGTYLGHPSLGCALCKGKGLVFKDAKQMTGLVSGVRAQRDLIEAGWVHPGNAVFSPSLHERRVTTFDKVTFTWAMPFNEGEVLIRGGGPTRPPETPILEDQLSFAAANPQAVWVMDEDGEDYSPGSYTLKGRRVQWSNGAGPAPGKRYTVKYDGFMEWLVFMPPDERRDRRMDLGQRVILRLLTASDINKEGDLRAALQNRKEGPPAYQDIAYADQSIEPPKEPFR